MDNRMWEKIDRQSIELEEIKRPSLTYWKDAFRRLKQNKLSMISLVFLIILIFSVIFIPMVWPRSYSDQVLEFQNIPPYIERYEVSEGSYIYPTKDFKVIIVSEKGKLIEAATLITTDVINKQNIFDVNGTQVAIDFGVKIRAEREYKQVLKDAKDDPTIDVEAALKKYEETKNFRVLVNNEEITEYKLVKNKTYLVGTDLLGRDYLIRVLYGGRISLTVAFAAAFINFIIGVTYGGISGYFGGKVDNVMMRIVDVISTIPLILYVIILMVVLSPSLSTIIIALSLTYWVRMARIVRGQVLSLREQEFVLAAKTIGASFPRILFRHIIPNAMGPIMVAITMQIPGAIFTEAFLSFIGIGVSAPIPSWGSLVQEAINAGRSHMTSYLMFAPAIVMSITLLAFNLLGDGLRDALDPRLRK